MQAKGGGSLALKGWLLIGSQMQIGENILYPLVQRLLTVMRMPNFSLLFLYPWDNHFREQKILPYTHILFNVTWSVWLNPHGR
jgi:hypothetical protein